MGGNVARDFVRGEPLAEQEPDGNRGIDMAARDVAEGVDHSHHGHPEGEGDADNADAESRQARTQECAPAAGKYQKECAECFGGQSLHHHPASPDRVNLPRTMPGAAAKRKRLYAVSRSGFQHQIERCLRCAPESCEPAFHDHISQSCLPCLGTEGWAIVCQGSGYADHRRRSVEDSAHRIQIIFHTVICERLHNHPGTILCERLLHVVRSADRIAHVMQTIEVGDEVVVLAG